MGKGTYSRDPANDLKCMLLRPLSDCPRCEHAIFDSSVLRTLDDQRPLYDQQLLAIISAYSMILPVSRSFLLPLVDLNSPARTLPAVDILRDGASVSLRNASFACETMRSCACRRLILV
jgi:hypothetical protein